MGLACGLWLCACAPLGGGDAGERQAEDGRRVVALRGNGQE